MGNKGKKVSIKNLIEQALQVEYIVSAPLVDYTIKELEELTVLSEEKKIIVTLKNESNNFYQGTLINILKRENLKENLLKFI